VCVDRESAQGNVTMVSSSLSQLLERARTRLGLKVDILDTAMRHVYPESGSELERLISETPGIRRTLLDVLVAGRPEPFESGGLSYRLIPLRRSTSLRNSGGLLAVRRTSQNGDSSGLDSWSELARAIVEADFAAVESLNEERAHSRRLLATLRFLRHLVETDTEAQLAHAVVQASAVWFDADGRIYQRDLAGDFLLHTALPGAQIDEAGQRLNSLWLSSSTEVSRVGSIAEWGPPAGTAEVVLVPLSSSVEPGDPSWVLALVGSVPTAAESMLPVIGRVVGLQLEAMRARRREYARERFETLVRQTGVQADLMAVDIVRELLEMTGAASAALTLSHRGRQRRLVTIGNIGMTDAAPSLPSQGEGDWLFGPDQFTCELRLDVSASATLELRPRSGETFSPDAALVTRAAARVLQVWLRVAEPSLREGAAPLPLPSATITAFVRRIEEELERARRFDLRLSLVLIDVPPQVQVEREVFAQLHDTLRRELRGSDVLGKMNGQRVAALLTHTDVPGSYKAVGRVRRRLAETALRLNVAGVTIGHAVFSPDCRTAEALVSQALRDAEPVAV
jgi:GGDEF domain-containing protein